MYLIYGYNKIDLIGKTLHGLNIAAYNLIQYANSNKQPGSNVHTIQTSCGVYPAS
jgi:hypothetical protein